MSSQILGYLEQGGSAGSRDSLEVALGGRDAESAKAESAGCGTSAPWAPLAATSLKSRERAVSRPALMAGEEAPGPAKHSV